MANISHYFKRRGRKSSSEASENELKSPEEKRVKVADENQSYCSDSDDILNALEMAEDIVPKIDNILSKLRVLENKIDRIEGHVGSVDETVSQLKKKVDNLESSLKEKADLVKAMEVKVITINEEVEKVKSEIAAIRKQQEYMEIYQRRENLRFYGIPEQPNGKEDSHEVLMEFLKNNLDMDYSDRIEIQRVHRIGKYEPGQDKPRQMIARFLRYPDREHVFSRANKLRGTGMGISADLPRSIVETRKKLMDKFKAAKRQGKRAFFSRAEPDKLYIDGRLVPA